LKPVEKNMLPSQTGKIKRKEKSRVGSNQKMDSEKKEIALNTERKS